VSNLYNQLPLLLTTDFTSWRSQQTLVAQTSNALAGIRPFKIVVASNGTTVAGTISITAPSDGALLYPVLLIPAGQATGSILYTDEIECPLNWRDFSVTGLTATDTVLYIWYRPDY
jgi:hypothetical protein